MPLTATVNKHLLPVYDRPMLHYPILTLLGCGVTELVIVTERRWQESFDTAISTLQPQVTANFSLAFQNSAMGIADALRCAQGHVSRSPLIVMLGDNIFQFSPTQSVASFTDNPTGAQLFLTEVTNPSEFGIATLKSNRVVTLQEKPSHPLSNLAATGLYLYDDTVFDRIDSLTKSSRGELEITDLNKSYLSENQLFAERVNGWWVDCGSFEGLYRASTLVRESPPQCVTGKTDKAQVKQ